MQFAPSICQQCSVGCNISPGERYGELRRIENRFTMDQSIIISSVTEAGLATAMSTGKIALAAQHCVMARTGRVFAG